MGPVYLGSPGERGGEKGTQRTKDDGRDLAELAPGDPGALEEGHTPDGKES